MFHVAPLSHHAQHTFWRSEFWPPHGILRIWVSILWQAWEYNPFATFPFYYHMLSSKPLHNTDTEILKILTSYFWALSQNTAWLAQGNSWPAWLSAQSQDSGKTEYYSDVLQWKQTPITWGMCFWLGCSFWPPMLSSEFRQRCQVQSRARHWLQLIGCTALDGCLKFQRSGWSRRVWSWAEKKLKADESELREVGC